METRDVLLDAIIARDANELRRLVVDEGVELNRMLSACILPLVYAANVSDFSICQLMVNLGSSLTRVESVHLPSPLANAVSLGFNAAIETLIRLGCDVNELQNNYTASKIDRIHRKGSLTLLNLAVRKQNFDAVKLLLQSGADINKADDQGNTSVHYLVRNCDGPCTLKKTLDYFLVQSLINPRPDLNSRNHYGVTPLMCAAMHENIEAVLCLVKEHVDLNAEDHVGYTALHYAVTRFSEDITLSLLRAGCMVSNPSWTDSPLSLAVLCSNGHSLDSLLKFGADAKEIFYSGRTLLHIAAGKGDLNMIDFALLSGISIDARDDDDATALITYDGELTTMKYLVQQKSARIDLKDSDNHSALFHNSIVFKRFAYLVVEGIPRSYEDYKIAAYDRTIRTRLLEFLLITEMLPLQRILSLPSLMLSTCRDLRMKWQAIASNPHSLKHICRLAIRNALVEHAGGKGIVLLTKNLPLPKCIQDYLCYLEELLDMGCPNFLDDNYCDSDSDTDYDGDYNSNYDHDDFDDDDDDYDDDDDDDDDRDDDQMSITTAVQPEGI